MKIIRRKLHEIVGGVDDDGESLTKSQLMQEHPWVEQFMTEIGPLLEDSISIELPEHFVNQVFRIFDANDDGLITKQEYVSKCNVLTTEGGEQQIAALFSLMDEDSDGLLVEEEVQGVLTDVAQLIHEATPQVLEQVMSILADRLTHHIYAEVKIPFGRIIPAETMHTFLLNIRKSLPNSALSEFVEGLVRLDRLDSKALFRQYSTSVISSTTGEAELGITPAMFGKLLDHIVDFDALFQSMDAWLPIDAGDNEAIKTELKALRLQLQERFVGENISISDLLFRALDLDNSGVIDRAELESFVELLHHSSTFAESNKANDLRQSMSAVAMTQLNITLETEVQHVMHVLEKKGRVTHQRLTSLIEAVLSVYRRFLAEYIDVHTNKRARHNELRRITHVWFESISGGKGSMNIRAFAGQLGSKLVTYLQ